MRILITGTSGFIGRELAPRLLARGHRIVGLSRDPARIPSGLRSQIEIIEGDALEHATLHRALTGCDVMVWLIHSMESGAQDSDFALRERESARLAVECAREAGTSRAVYLGGIAPQDKEASPHLASRLEVERILLDGLPDSTALRASIVIGAGSRSFRFLVRLVERLPALPLPSWRDHLTAPIDVRDACAALVRSVEGAAPGRTLDIAGPDRVSYGELIGLIAERMLLDRPSITLPFDLTPMAAPVAATIAGEDPELILPLMGSLGSDLLPREDGLAELGVRPHSLASAIDRALGDWEAIEELAAR